MTDVRFIGMKELCHIFGDCSRDTIERMFAAGRMRRVKMGPRTFARSDDVAAEINRLTAATTAKAA